MNSMQPSSIRSGWVTFAAVMAFVVGLFNVLSGIAAIAEDDLTEQVGEVLYGVDITAWGWFWLLIGTLQVITAYLIYTRSTVGLLLGIIWAVIGATLTVFIIFTYPIWGLVVLAINLLIIFGLTDNADEFS
jgi:hypothetical protein